MENNEYDKKEYDKITKILSMKNDLATKEQLKDKLNILSKQKFELYTMIENITKEEKQIQEILNKK